MRLATAVFVLFAACPLTGCVTALVGGLQSSSISVTADPATVKPEIGPMLAGARHIALVTPKDNEVAIYFAEYLDLQGGYVVTTSEEAQGWTPSARRDAMQHLCATNPAIDIVSSSSAGRTDAGGKTVLKGLVTGRASFTTTSINELLHCKSGTRTSFTVVSQVSQGIYNADRTAANRLLGEELGRLFLRLSGKEVAP